MSLLFLNIYFLDIHFIFIVYNNYITSLTKTQLPLWLNMFLVFLSTFNNLLINIYIKPQINPTLWKFKNEFNCSFLSQCRWKYAIIIK